MVVEKASAEEQYEEAITSGDTAIMLELVQPGLYTMNVGNIMADEEVTITILYAELYFWQGETLRFRLPTTIAPRYGDPERAGLQSQQIPDVDLLVENRFHLKLTLSGHMADARLDCPSHQVAITHSKGDTVVSLTAGEACMDRDFILNISLPQGRKDSMFGSTTCKSVFDRQVQADKENITKVRRLLRSLDADMGGTEMHQALQEAVRLPGPPIPQDILLITDGEVWESDEIIRTMKKSGHRVFTVGVGSSVAEGPVRQLAEETGGSWELVVPGEEMAEKIVRHFRRIYLPRAEGISIGWPVNPVKVNHQPNLLDAMRELPVEERGDINRSKLGWLLKKNANRIFGDFEFQQAAADGRNAWRVVAVKSPPPPPLTPSPPLKQSVEKTVNGTKKVESKPEKQPGRGGQMSLFGGWQ